MTLNNRKTTNLLVYTRKGRCSGCNIAQGSRHQTSCEWRLARLAEIKANEIKHNKINAKTILAKIAIKYLNWYLTRKKQWITL